MLHLNFFGPLSLRCDDGIEVDQILSHPKRLALLAYLALASPRGFQRRDTLVAVFWPERDQFHARAALRQLLHGLRMNLGVQCIISRGTDEVRLNDEIVQCDVWQFDEAVVDGALQRAVELRAGPLLYGFHLGGAPEFERWLEGERRRYERQCEKLLEDLAARAEREDEADAVVGWLERLLEVDPYRGRVVEWMMRTLVRVGDRARAIRLANTYAERLRAELGAEPSHEVVTLAEELRGESGPEFASVSRPTDVQGADDAAGRGQLGAGPRASKLSDWLWSLAWRR